MFYYTVVKDIYEISKYIYTRPHSQWNIFTTTFVSTFPCQLGVPKEVSRSECQSNFLLCRAWLNASVPLLGKWVKEKLRTLGGHFEFQQVSIELIDNDVISLHTFVTIGTFWHWTKNHRGCPYQILLPCIHPFTQGRLDKAIQGSLWSDWKKKE